MVLLALLALAFFFFASKANLQIAADDAVWLQGEAPTVFDRYRQIPRLFFVALYALFGASAPAALALIFFTHALNGLLVYLLARRWLTGADEGAGGGAALAAAGVFLVNPLTLNTLTWISCLSYVQGTTLALLALLACWRALEARGGPRLAWSAAALAAFGAGLFGSHEIFFLPAVFLVLGWLRRELRLGGALCLLGAGLAGLVNALVYDFGRYGVEAGRLFTADFALAYASSGLSSGLALLLAYPLSFLARTVGFLQACFAEPARWAMTAALVAAAAWSWGRRDRDRHDEGRHRDGRRHSECSEPPSRGRLDLSLALAFVVLITPYLIRLYLTPETVNYHISYVLSGRVFYLAFVPLALILGRATAWLGRRLRDRRGAWLALALPLAAFLHALWLYDRADFLGLNVVRGAAASAPPRWNPYTAQQPGWLLLPLLAGVLALAGRRLLARRGSRPLPPRAE